MSDFNIDVGFNTKGFTDMFGKGRSNNVDSGVGGTTTGGKSKLSSGIGKGFMIALKSTGILALLMSLKIIVDLLSGILATINLLVILGFKGMFEFFKDPVRGLLGLGVFIVNGIIALVENMVNFIKFGSDVDFGRYKLDVFDEKLDAGTSLFKALDESFMTEEQYQKYKQDAMARLSVEAFEAEKAEREANAAKVELTNLMQEDFTSNVVPAFDGLSSTMTTFFINWRKAMNEANDKLSDDRSSSVRFATKYKGSALTEAEKYGAARRQSTTIKEADARAYNYLTGLSN